MRDKNGRFSSGNSFGQGRPKGSGKKHVKEMTWEALNRVVQLLFTIPEGDLVKWVKENSHQLSRAEKVFLENTNSTDLKHLNNLLDRVIGKPTFNIPEAENDEEEDLIEALQELEEEEFSDSNKVKPKVDDVEKVIQPKKKRKRKRRRKNNKGEENKGKSDE